MSSLALSWLYSGPRQVGVVFLGAASSNVFSTHSREDMWSLAVVSVSICPHCRAQVTALEPGPEQSRDTAGDGFSLQHPLTQMVFPGLQRGCRWGGTEKSHLQGSASSQLRLTHGRMDGEHVSNAWLKASQETAVRCGEPLMHDAATHLGAGFVPNSLQ